MRTDKSKDDTTDHKDASGTTPGRSRRRRSWRFRTAAVFAGFMPFLLLEVSLRIADVGNPQQSADPSAGFGGRQRLFERDEERGVYRCALALREFFVAEEFPLEKKESVYRVFCLGGSTVQGRPYKPQTAFSQWMEIELNARDGSRSYEVVNCGGISYAGYRLLPVLREVLEYRPDLIVLATGHNEFLEDRTYQSLKQRSELRSWIEDRANSLHTVNVVRNLLAPETKPSKIESNETGEKAVSSTLITRLDNDNGYASYQRDPEWHQQVIRQYEDSLRGMVQLCREAGVPLLLVNLGCNLRDCPPYKSQHKAGLSLREEADWQAVFDEATRVEPDDPNEALRLYRRAEKLDAEYALLIYRIARVHDRLNQNDEAREYYLRAKELDICPLRMLEPLHAALRKVADETGTELVDAQGLFASIGDKGIPGFDWFLDHVHPTIGGHQQMAQAVVAHLQQSSMVSLQESWPESQRRAAYRKHLDQLDRRYLADGRRRVEWLENWARRQRLFEETLPVNAAGFLRFGFRRLDFGEEQGAAEAILFGLEDDPAAARQVLDHATRLVSQGRPQTAEWLIQQFSPKFTDTALQTEAKLALLVLAFETEQSDRAAEIFMQHEAAFQQADFTGSPWLTLMPDVFTRAAELSSSGKP